MMLSLKTVNDIANALDVWICQVFNLDGIGNYKCLNCNRDDDQWSIISYIYKGR